MTPFIAYRYLPFGIYFASFDTLHTILGYHSMPLLTVITLYAQTQFKANDHIQIRFYFLLKMPIGKMAICFLLQIYI